MNTTNSHSHPLHNSSIPNTRTPGGVGPSQLDMMELLGKALREQEQRIQEIEDTLLSRPIAPEVGPSQGFMTVNQYSFIRGLNISIAQMLELDRRTQVFCRDLGIQMGNTWDDLFGEVNTYHFHALDDVYAEWPQSGCAQ